MRLTARLFARPKRGEAADDAQDAAACDGARGLAAVADGATDSAFQALWARLLVQAWVTLPPFGESGPELDEWLDGLRIAWHAQVPWQNLPWHGSAKAMQTGGLATLLGVVVAEREGALEVAALAVGDCGLMLFDRSGSLRLAWPLESADAFTSTPTLLSSLTPLPEDAWERALLAETSFALQRDDLLLLGTDAAIQWLLRRKEEEEELPALVALLEAAATPLCPEALPPPADALARAETRLATARTAGHLRNDDVTLLFLRSAT